MLTSTFFAQKHKKCVRTFALLENYSLYLCRKNTDRSALFIYNSGL